MPYNIYRVMYTHQGPSEASFSNVWHFSTANAQVIDNSAPGIVEGQILHNALHEFYNDWAPGGAGVAMNNVGNSIKIYNYTVPTGAHEPVYEWTNNTNPYAVTGPNPAFPWEVSVCLSFEAFMIPGGNRARRRGRVYLGPLTTDSAEYDGYGNCWVSPAFRADVLDAFKTMVDTCLAGGYACGPYSKTDGIHLQLSTAWVDDAYDTQRRRGNKPSVQTRVDRLLDQSGWV